MAGFTDAYELVVLDATFTNTDKAALSANGSSELALGGYARQTLTWAAAASGAKANSAVATFGAASESWGSITHFAIFTSAGTQMTDWTALTAPKTVASGDSLSFAVGALTVTLD